jgi:modulator of FtsH protease HflC
MKRFLIPLAVLLIILILNTMYVVREIDQVIITQFGEPVGDPVLTPGLKFKLPFIQEVHRFDKRFLEWDGDPNELPTRDKRFILVNNYARWRITDPLLFFQRLHNERGAQTRLDDIIDGETRNAIAAYDLVELVRVTNRQPDDVEVGRQEQTIIMESIESGRNVIREEILAKSQSRTSDLGIEILDVEFKRINYVTEVQRKVYERMVSERQRVADRFRSEGEGEAFRIRGEKDRELLRIRSEAYRRAQEIKGTADAEATNIYAAAYNGSPETRSFYEFLKTMESYKTSLDNNSSLVLSTESDFYRYLKGNDGQ